MYDLTTIPEGVLVRGKSFTLAGNPTNSPTIRLAAVPLDPDNPGAARPGTMTVADGNEVRFEGVRFELVDSPSVTTVSRSDDPVGLAVSGPGRVSFSSCRFEPAVGLQAASVTGLAVVAPASDTATKIAATNLNISHCYFAVRQTVGVRLVGPVRASVTESAFAPIRRRSPCGRRPMLVTPTPAR